jgi:hypothetical protein
VPAVAVIQGGLALFLGTWRKEYVGIDFSIKLEILGGLLTSRLFNNVSIELRRGAWNF